MKRISPKVIGAKIYWPCPTCKTVKPENEYYKKPKRWNGISSQCKKCYCESTIKTRDVDNARAKNAIYMRRARLKNPELFRGRERAASILAKKKHPKKVYARYQLNKAVANGSIKKPDSCQSCGGNRKINGHHDDYNKPLAVRWLCYECHGKEHRMSKFKRVDK